VSTEAQHPSISETSQEHADLSCVGNPVVDPVEDLLEKFQHRERIQAGSLLISIFGDTVVPRGGRIWLGSLIRLLEPLGLSERLVRTAVFRLVRSGWLDSTRIGRRTEYFLTPSAAQRFEDAAASIYAARAPSWDRRWRLILVIGELVGKDRELLHKALSWHGFGALNNNSFVHPNANLVTALESLVTEGLGHLSHQLKPLIAADVGLGAAASEAAMVQTAWDLQQLAERYRNFVARYQPALAALHAGASEVSDENAFLLRLLLVHDYRHLLLRDPVLPDVLLPADWPGQQARVVCRDLYRRLLPATERHLDGCFQLADGTTPKATQALTERFRAADPLALAD